MNVGDRVEVIFSGWTETTQPLVGDAGTIIAPGAHGSFRVQFDGKPYPGDGDWWTFFSKELRLVEVQNDWADSLELL